MKLAFFGSSEFSVYVLEELKAQGVLPSLIITTPDKPKGRKLVLTPTLTKVWAKKNNIAVIDPDTLRNHSLVAGQEISAKEFLANQNWDLFLVASYGKIIPKEIFDIPVHKTLNIHPSLLPKYRGASPIQSQILEDAEEIGVSIMQIDAEMDHGPIVAQKKTSPPFNLNTNVKIRETLLSLIRRGGLGGEVSGEIPNQKELEKILATEGTKLFLQILPDWLEGKIKPIPQDDSQATFCKKIEKENGELQIDLGNLPTREKARQDLLKIKAFVEWPTTYFFTDRGGKWTRVIITEATLNENGSLQILKVIPEGKKEMAFADFMRGQK